MFNMEHWIGYYAAFYGAFGLAMVWEVLQAASEEGFKISSWKTAIFILPPLPLILHAWGVL